MEKSFQSFDHGKGKIDLTHHQSIITMRPVEIHHKADGSRKDEPSFCIVMASPFSPTVAGEISLEMLNVGLSEIGYEIVRKQNDK